MYDRIQASGVHAQPQRLRPCRLCRLHHWEVAHGSCSRVDVCKVHRFHPLRLAIMLSGPHSHVLQQHLVIEIPAFCDFLDRICMSCSSDLRMKKFNCWTNFTSPRSWFFQLINHLEPPLRQDFVMPLLAKLLSFVPSLLNCIYIGDATFSG
jgi:hypothetical protein